ncbi:MAG: hypothetical protein WC805_02980 [Patescibacteria group bacterium]|jgi:hypothetical protein
MHLGNLIIAEFASRETKEELPLPVLIFVSDAPEYQALRPDGSVFDIIDLEEETFTIDTYYASVMDDVSETYIIGEAVNSGKPAFYLIGIFDLTNEVHMSALIEALADHGWIDPGVTVDFSDFTLTSVDDVRTMISKLLYPSEARIGDLATFLEKKDSSKL